MLYKLTIKNNRHVNGIRLEKGMTAEVSFQSASLLGNIQGQELAGAKRISGQEWH